MESILSLCVALVQKLSRTYLEQRVVELQVIHVLVPKVRVKVKVRARVRVRVGVKVRVSFVVMDRARG